MAKGKAGNTAEAKTSAAKTYASAMDKLRDEMATDNSEYVRVVGEYLTDYLLEHPEAEAALLNSAKTIHGSLKQIEAEEWKHKTGNVGIVSDVRAFGMVLEYFGITEGTGNRQQGTGNREQGTGEATEGTSSVTAAPCHLPQRGKAGEAPVDFASREVSEICAAKERRVAKNKETTAPEPDPFDLDVLLGVG